MLTLPSMYKNTIKKSAPERRRQTARYAWTVSPFQTREAQAFSPVPSGLIQSGGWHSVANGIRNDNSKSFLNDSFLILTNNWYSVKWILTIRLIFQRSANSFKLCVLSRNRNNCLKSIPSKQNRHPLIYRVKMDSCIFPNQTAELMSFFTHFDVIR